MTKFIVALLAVLLLALSSNFTNAAVIPHAPGQPASAAMVRLPEPAFAATLAAPAATGIAQGDEGPAPALLVYLVFVLVSSVVSVALVRRGIGREA